MIVIKYEAPASGGSSEAGGIKISAFVLTRRTIKLDVRGDPHENYTVNYCTPFGTNGEDIVDAIRGAGIDIARIRRYNEDRKSDDGPRGEPAWEWLLPSGKPELIMHRHNGILQDSIHREPACLTFDKDGNLEAAASVQNGVAQALSRENLITENKRRNAIAEVQRERRNRYPLMIENGDQKRVRSSMDVIDFLPLEARKLICQIILEKDGMWTDGPKRQPSEVLLSDGEIYGQVHRSNSVIREEHSINKEGVQHSSFYNEEGEPSWGPNGEPAMKSVYPNGQTKSIHYRKNGKDCVGPDGKTISMGWYPDGTVRCATYKTENGTERLTYYPDGTCENSGKFTSNGDPAPGLHQSFHANGVPASSISIDQNGKKHTHPNGDAAVTAWDENGNVVKAIHYNHGVKLEGEKPKLPGISNLPKPGGP